MFNTKKGFTLIEILLAFSLSMSVIGYTLYSLSKSDTMILQIQRNANNYREIQNALDCLKRDIELLNFLNPETLISLITENAFIINESEDSTYKIQYKIINTTKNGLYRLYKDQAHLLLPHCTDYKITFFIKDPMGNIKEMDELDPLPTQITYANIQLTIREEILDKTYVHHYQKRIYLNYSLL